MRSGFFHLPFWVSFAFARSVLFSINIDGYCNISRFIGVYYCKRQRFTQIRRHKHVKNRIPFTLAEQSAKFMLLDNGIECAKAIDIQAKS